MAFALLHSPKTTSASAPPHAPAFTSVWFLSLQQNDPPSTSLASGPAKCEREDGDKMSQVTKEMATRMLHMTQFLRKKGPIVVWSVPPPPPQPFHRHKHNIFCSEVRSEAATGLLTPLRYSLLYEWHPLHLSKAPRISSPGREATLVSSSFPISECSWDSWTLPCLPPPLPRRI